MGTHGDFFIKKNNQPQWIGSVTLDGSINSIPDQILLATDEKEYVDLVTNHCSGLSGVLPLIDRFICNSDNYTSYQNEYTYIFDAGKVYCSYYGSVLFDPLDTNIDIHDLDIGPYYQFNIPALMVEHEIEELKGIIDDFLWTAGADGDMKVVDVMKKLVATRELIKDMEKCKEGE